ncbi:ATP-binding cassette domain-containing protein [Staphylococcus xylosus]|uniref:ATP-binding cassette domain-containing protein n=1 Tax=Staphylococcus xylosus TaxID=1288 RepID=UPI002DBFB020|nr:ATP-binding cassette domain-containing protein [Staphylococcus xylosus]MEB8103785.1 ATP-binding cassette domain-containing protein [Staphylococcus xylosus]
MTIEFQNCKKKFKNTLILDEQYFEIPDGINRLAGKNGSGKSTLLRMITGLDKDYTGEIIKPEKNILYLTPDPIGVIPFTIRENLKILWDSFDIQPSIEELQIVDQFFDGKLDIPYNKASTGMKAKLGLSLIFVKPWDLIIVDEAMSTIDSESLSLLIHYLIDNIHQKYKTVIYVSHTNLDSMLKLDSYNILLEEGKLSWIKNNS